MKLSLVCCPRLIDAKNSPLFPLLSAHERRVPGAGIRELDLARHRGQRFLLGSGAANAGDRSGGCE